MRGVQSTIRLLFFFFSFTFSPIVIAVSFSLLCLSVLFSGRSQQQEMEPVHGHGRDWTGRPWDHRRKGGKDRGKYRVMALYEFMFQQSGV